MDQIFSSARLLPILSITLAPQLPAPVVPHTAGAFGALQLPVVPHTAGALAALQLPVVPHTTGANIGRQNPGVTLLVFL